MVVNKMQEICNFLQRHRNDVDVETAFQEAKKDIASKMLQVTRKEFYLNLSITEMCEEWAIASYLAHFSCVEDASEDMFCYERTLSLAYSSAINKVLGEKLCENL